MYYHQGFVDVYIKEHTAELMREAEVDRLVQQAKLPGRPVRLRVAEWLYAAAERIEGSPRQPAARAHA